MSPPRIGLIGLGEMGSRIGRRLSSLGARPWVFDVDERRMGESADWASATQSTGDLVESVDIILTVLPADQHVLSVTEQIAAVARPGQAVVECSTVLPATAGAVESILAARDVATISVSITRGTPAAETGQLLLFAGGRRSSEVDDTLTMIAAETRWADSVETPKALKIVNNMLLGNANLSCSEALVVAERYGHTYRAVVDALATSPASSWALENQVRRHILTDDLGPGRFSTLLMAKDHELFLQIATQGGQEPDMAKVALGYYEEAIDMGLGLDYHPIAIRVIEVGAPPGVEPSQPGSVLPDLVNAVAACQTAAAFEACRVLEHFGIEREAGHRFLIGASGETTALAEVATATDDRTIALRHLESLERALDLAVEVDVPTRLMRTACQVLLREAMHPGA